MKNAVTKVIILFLTTSLGALAQDAVSSNSPLRFGIHVSPNISYIQSDDPEAESASKVKFAFGLMAEYNFAANYSFSTGVDYIFRGGELTLPVAKKNSLGNDIEVKRTGVYKAGMVQVPLFLKMRTNEFGYMRYFAEFGGRLGFPVDQTSDFQDNPVGYELTEKESSENYINPIDVMFSIGIGTEYSLGGNTSVVAGLYYNRSLADNLKNTESKLGTADDYNYRFDYVNLKIGILF